MSKLRLEYIEAGSLADNPANWRTHPAGQTDALKELIGDPDIGWAGACLYNERTKRLIDGHARKNAVDPATPIPVLIGDWSEAAEKKILLTLDPLAGMAVPDAEALRKLMDEVELDGEALKSLTDGLDELLEKQEAEDNRNTEVVEDESPDPDQVETRCKPGDLWKLGTHRLLCGDSTKAEDVKRVMGGEKAGLMNTDPPYGVSYANDDRPNPGVAKPRVANDTLQDEQLQTFLESAFRAAVDCALLPDAAWYMWHAHLTQGYFAAAAAAAANVVLHRQIIWVKPVLLLGRGQYHWKHEPCFMGWVEGHQPPDYGLGAGERTQTTIWEIDGVQNADRKEFDHATPKPVGLFSIPIVKHLKTGQIAFEPFAGSGPQFIAAEQLNRRCFGIEISPKYCDVILARWEKLTGKQAEKIDA